MIFLFSFPGKQREVVKNLRHRHTVTVMVTEHRIQALTSENPQPTLEGVTVYFFLKKIFSIINISGQFTKSSEANQLAVTSSTPDTFFFRVTCFIQSFNV